MRTAFADELCRVAARDERVWLLCGDLGYSVLEPYAAAFPSRFVNVGVAEQDMIGLAAGLAMAGRRVFVYSIANFPVLRCLEQIRNDVCHHELDVTVVSVGGGYAYGSLGPSHHGLEDLAVMRVLPGMTVVAPGDPIETRLATAALARRPGPSYLRLGKAGEPVVHVADPEFEIGSLLTVRAGSGVAVVTTGGILATARNACDELSSRHGLDVRLLSCPTLAPLAADTLLGALDGVGVVVTVEEHGRGGLGTIVAEVLAEADAPIRLRSLRTAAEPHWQAGSQDALRAADGIDQAGIVRVVLQERAVRPGDPGMQRAALQARGGAEAFA